MILKNFNIRCLAIVFFIIYLGILFLPYTKQIDAAAVDFLPISGITYASEHLTLFLLLLILLVLIFIFSGKYKKYRVVLASLFCGLSLYIAIAPFLGKYLPLSYVPGILALQQYGYYITTILSLAFGIFIIKESVR